ncbi:cytochrome-c peroxidase [Flavobacteriaceae bacterium]|nr:cytochrome-c peroxidase [Flavobacteriaceae bacterium]
MLKKILFISGIIFLMSCKNDDDSYTSLLDDELDVALFEASNDIGKSFYLLPNETDFSNIPQDPNNIITEDKVNLGKLLFHETALAINAEKPSGIGTYSCASCHHSKAGFQAGKRQGIGDGGFGFGFLGESRVFQNDYTIENSDIQQIRSPSTLNTAYQNIMLWNGQFGATGLNQGTESQWTEGTPKAVNNLGFEGLETQAIAGMEVHRLEVNLDVVTSLDYKLLFDNVFSEIPESNRYTNKTAGLAIAAYERTLLTNMAPFQKWLKGNSNAMSDNEKKGAILFFDKAQCAKCHNGPSLALMDFSAIGMNDLVGADVFGDITILNRKGRGGFTMNPNDDYKFKIPQLYNIKSNGSFGHGASFTSVKEVVEYKNNAVKQNINMPSNSLDARFSPLSLTNEEIDLIVLFIENALHDNTIVRYVPENVFSGACFPNNDVQSKEDLGCN